MYTEYFGFREKPFNITPDPQFFYTNPGYQEAYASLLYGVRERKGVVLLSGEVGTGKTTLLYRLKEHFTPPVHCVFLSNPNIAFDELLDYICSELQLAGELHGRLQKIQALQAFLMQCLQDGGTGVLLIDEAQDLEDQVLENLRLLSNLETTSDKLLQIVLSGQPELELKLAQPKWRQLRQRIAVKHRLLGLQEQEIAAFIHHRLQTVGYERQDLFPPQVVQRIAVYSKNIPRLINIICDNALLITYGLNKKTVSVDVIEEVAQDLELAPAPRHYASSGDASGQEREVPQPAESQPRVITPQDNSADSAAQAENLTENLPENLNDIPVWQRAPSPAFSRSDFHLPSRRMQIGLGILLGLFLLGGTVLPVQKLLSFFSLPADTLVASSPPQHVAATTPHGEPNNTSQTITKTSPASASNGSPSAGSPSEATQTVSSGQSVQATVPQTPPVLPFIPSPEGPKGAKKAKEESTQSQKDSPFIASASVPQASQDSDTTLPIAPVVSGQLPPKQPEVPNPSSPSVETAPPTVQPISPISASDNAKQATQNTQTATKTEQVELAAGTPATAQLSPSQETVPQATSLIIQKGTTIYDIVLRAYGTYSPLALDLVKEFNPQLQDLSRISVGHLLKLPPQTRESLLRKQEDGSYQLILASFHTAQHARAFTRRVEREGYRTQTTQRQVSRNLLLHRVTITDLSNREAAAQAWRFVNGMNISG